MQQLCSYTSDKPDIDNIQRIPFKMSYSTISYAPPVSYAGLEQAVSYNSAAAQNDISCLVPQETFSSPDRFQPYSLESYICQDKNYNINRTKQVYQPITDNFLADNRQCSVFIGSASEIEDFVKQAFTAVTENRFPEDIILRVLSKEDFKKANHEFGGAWNEGIMGFAVNRKTQGKHSEIFVRKGELDKIMLTIGHEIGHTLTRTLENKKDEEAKAFAFSIAWMKKIKELNIANLSTSICLDSPARNGIHDVALDFTLRFIEKGKDAYSLFKDLASGNLRLRSTLQD